MTTSLVWEYRWASDRGAHTMPHPDELRQERAKHAYEQ